MNNAETQTEAKANWRDAHDYTMSWACYRALCIEHGEPDPGPLEPQPDPRIAELEARIAKLEEEHYIKLAAAVMQTATMKAPAAKPPKFKGIQKI